jgi:beta-glucosidase
MENRTYRYFRGEPLYPFGFGLGFEPFELSGASFKDGAVTVTVINKGKARAAEIVQTYIEIEGERENWSLCGINPVELDAGVSAEIKIIIPDAAFMRYGANGDLRPCPGKKTLHIGVCQPDSRSVALKGCAPLKITLDN